MNTEKYERLSWTEFRKAVRAYYGVPVSSGWMSRIYKYYKAGNHADLPRGLVDAMAKANP